MGLERGHEGWTVWRGLLLGLLWARAQISARIPTFGLLGLAAWATTFYFARRLYYFDLERLTGLHVSRQVLIGRDFVNVWTGGLLARLGDLGVIYDVPAYRFVLRKAMELGGIYAYSYPPHTLLLAVPFSLFSYPVALALWTAVGAALFCHAARPYLSRVRLPMLVALILPGSLVNIWAGHYGFLVGALALYGWRWLDTHPRRAGIIFGIMTIKPHLGVLVALVLLLRRDWTAIGWAAATTGALALVSGSLFGFGLWPVYVLKTLLFQADLFTGEVTRSFHHMMPTTSAAILLLGYSETTAKFWQAASALIAVAVVIEAFRRRVDTLDLGLIASTAVFLVVPYAFNYDMTVVSLAALVFLARASEWEGFWTRLGLQTVLAIGFVLPLALPWLGQQDVVIGPVVLALMLGGQLMIAVGSPWERKRTVAMSLADRQPISA